MPVQGSEEQRAALASALAEALQQRATEQPRESTVACRMLCLLGSWCVENGFNPQASRCLELAQALAREPGEHQLWVADLMRKLDNAAAADEIELSLLKSRALPPLRIEGLLSRLAKSRGQAFADTLSKEAQTYCKLIPAKRGNNS